MKTTPSPTDLFDHPELDSRAWTPAADIATDMDEVLRRNASLPFPARLSPGRLQRWMKVNHSDPAPSVDTIRRWMKRRSDELGLGK